MNKFLYILGLGAAAMALQLSVTSCADVAGDGEGTIIWEGSQNPENTSYRNPVWEPSLAGGTMLKGASNFSALSAETQWAVGVDYPCPSLRSADLMSWAYSKQTAFSTGTLTEDEDTGETSLTGVTYPDWISGKITQVSADFARTISGANYWMFYLSEADNAIGAASASSGLGPYTDQGCVLTAEQLGKTTLTDPFFAVFASTSYYLCYTTDDGSYIQQLTISRGKKPTLKGSATKLTDTNITDIALYRKSAKDFYLFGTVKTDNGTEVRYARASSLTGPYLDHDGKSILDGSNGELLIQASSEYTKPCNVMRGVESDNGYFYIAYNASAVGYEVMPSGYARQPMFVSPVTMDDAGWFTSVISPVTGWTTPRYE